MANMVESSSAEKAMFELVLQRDDFKFNAAHFVAYKGYRERLHGHNYRVSARVYGEMMSDGYVIDFGDVKSELRALCKEMNEHFLCPVKSDVLAIEEKDNQVNIQCEDGAAFSFPRGDCLMLPIVHSTAEELAVYIWDRLADRMRDKIGERRIETLEISVAEAPTQEARYKCRLGAGCCRDAQPAKYYGPAVVRGCLETLPGC